MRHFRFYEPDGRGNNVTVTVSDSWIEKTYFPHWLEKVRAKKANHPSFECEETLDNCIEDFLVVSWGWEVK